MMIIKNDDLSVDQEINPLQNFTDTLKKKPRHHYPSIQDDEFTTPWEIYYKVERETRVRFELDPFATDKNAKCPYYFTIKENAFAIDWLLPNNKIPAGVFVNHPHRYHELTIKTITNQYVKWGFPVVMIIPSNCERTIYYDYYIERFRIGAKPDYDNYPKLIMTFPLKGSIQFLKDGHKSKEASRNAYKVVHWLKKTDSLFNIKLMEYFR